MVAADHSVSQRVEDRTSTSCVPGVGLLVGGGDEFGLVVEQSRHPDVLQQSGHDAVPLLEGAEGLEPARGAAPRPRPMLRPACSRRRPGRLAALRPMLRAVSWRKPARSSGCSTPASSRTRMVRRATSSEKRGLLAVITHAHRTGHGDDVTVAAHAVGRTRRARSARCRGSRDVTFSLTLSMSSASGEARRKVTSRFSHSSLEEAAPQVVYRVPHAGQERDTGAAVPCRSRGWGPRCCAAVWLRRSCRGRTGSSMSATAPARSASVDEGEVAEQLVEQLARFDASATGRAARARSGSVEAAGRGGGRSATRRRSPPAGDEPAGRGEVGCVGDPGQRRQRCGGGAFEAGRAPSPSSSLATLSPPLGMALDEVHVPVGVVADAGRR